MKQPSWKIPLILSALLLILSSITYWFQFSQKPKTERVETENKKPLGLPSAQAQIVQFRIKGAAQVIEGKCDSLAKKTCNPSAVGEWTITYPAEVKGDADAIRNFITGITSMSANEILDLSTETPEKRKTLLDEYGLSPEKRTKIGTEFIEFTFDDGKKIAAWFGEPHPVGDKIFVGRTENGNLNENSVYLISNFYKGDFNKTLTHFRDKTILSFKRTDLTQFQAKTTFGKLQGQLDQGLWKVNGKAGDFDRIETLFSAISQLRAKDFPLEDVLKGAKSLDQYSLKTKAANFSLELFEKTTSGKTRYYVKSSGIKEVVEVEPIFRTQIDKKLTELRQGLLVSETEKATATEFKLESKELAVPAEFHYTGKTWTLKDPSQKMDPAKVSNLLGILSSVRARDIVSPAPTKMGDAATLTLGDSKNPAKSHILFFTTAEPGKTYAKDLNQNENEAFLLDESIKIALPFPLTSWKIK